MNWQCLIVRGFRNWPSTLHNAMHSRFAQEVKTFCKRCYCSEKTRSMDFTFEWFNGLLPIPKQLGSLKKTTFHSSISISPLTHIQGFFRLFSNLNQNLKLQHCSRFPYMVTIITLLSSCSQEIVYSFSIIHLFLNSFFYLQCWHSHNINFKPLGSSDERYQSFAFKLDGFLSRSESFHFGFDENENSNLDKFILRITFESAPIYH